MGGSYVASVMISIAMDMKKIW